ncbi:hypothetical protein QTL95_17900 [Rhizobium sp. S152]|uniref:hypothetical protein n=1 Tax=Rhizobium sp. S152 TaxID=3055038 RepID=UPI0025A95914|nr:hypothetical protein [Rhizobium sp. S152]MDM9627769.1 hypothetical protein [Rhizobium sp. S152]
MDDRKGYTNTDELQADDQISPTPSPDDKEARSPRSSDAKSDGADDDERIPIPATSE